MKLLEDCLASWLVWSDRRRRGHLLSVLPDRAQVGQALTPEYTSLLSDIFQYQRHYALAITKRPSTWELHLIKHWNVTMPLNALLSSLVLREHSARARGWFRSSERPGHVPAWLRWFDFCSDVGVRAQWTCTHAEESRPTHLRDERSFFSLKVVLYRSVYLSGFELLSLWQKISYIKS